VHLEPARDERAGDELLILEDCGQFHQSFTCIFHLSLSAFGVKLQEPLAFPA